MNSYTLEIGGLSPAGESLFGEHNGYAMFGDPDAVRFVCNWADWLAMGRPVKVSVMVHAVREEALDG